MGSHGPSNLGIWVTWLIQNVSVDQGVQLLISGLPRHSVPLNLLGGYPLMDIHSLSCHAPFFSRVSLPSICPGRITTRENFLPFLALLLPGFLPSIRPGRITGRGNSLPFSSRVLLLPRFFFVPGAARLREFTPFPVLLPGFSPINSSREDSRLREFSSFPIACPLPSPDFSPINSSPLRAPASFPNQFIP